MDSYLPGWIFALERDICWVVPVACNLIGVSWCRGQNPRTCSWAIASTICLPRSLFTRVREALRHVLSNDFHYPAIRQFCSVSAEELKLATLKGWLFKPGLLPKRSRLLSVDHTLPRLTVQPVVRRWLLDLANKPRLSNFSPQTRPATWQWRH